MKEYRFKINGHDYCVGVGEVGAQSAKVTVNGVSYDVLIEGGAAGAPAGEIPEHVRDDGPAAQSPAATPAQSAPAAAPAPGVASSAGAVTSPLPGTVLEICVREGQAVARSQKLAVIEAMKMENEVLAERNGTVALISVSKGDSVQEGDTIMTIA